VELDEPPRDPTAPLCPASTLLDTDAKPSGQGNAPLLNIQVTKLFTCTDGSGTFTLELQVHLKFDPFSDVASWVVVDGTGRYAGLSGTGSLTGELLTAPDSDPALLHDSYSGKVALG
jgi:hypothetical protein